MLRMENVRKSYKDFTLDCSMQVPEGYITGLIGANGAGKSTTFKSILGLVHPDSGEVSLFGKPVTDITVNDKQQMGVVLADSGFSGYLRIKDLIPTLNSLYPSFNKKDFIDKCAQLNLPLDKKIKDFSTGMKRKLQVLAAVSHDAKFLILDEPTAGLDVVARDEILEMLREYMETDGRSILISSHISSDLEGFCDDLYMIDQGKIVLHEDTDCLLSDYAILKVTAEQYEMLDKQYLLRHKKDTFGYSCLTDQRQFYQENFPNIQIEKGTIDELIFMMIRGEQ